MEYLVVLLALTAMVAALGALANLGIDGVLARLAVWSASHAVGGTNISGAFLDVMMY